MLRALPVCQGPSRSSMSVTLGEDEAAPAAARRQGLAAGAAELEGEGLFHPAGAAEDDRAELAPEALVGADDLAAPLHGFEEQLVGAAVGAQLRLPRVSRFSTASAAACSSGVAAATQLPPCFGGAAVPGGDDAAGILDQRDQRADVDILERRLDHEVDMAGRQQAVAVAIEAVAGRAARRGAARFQARSVPARSNMSGEVAVSLALASSVTLRGAERHAVCSPRIAGGLAGQAEVDLAGEGLRHQAGDGPAVDGEADQRAPDRDAGDEGAGAVDRVDDPVEAAVEPLLVVPFLADDGVVGEALADQLRGWRARPRGRRRSPDRSRRLLVVDGEAGCGSAAGCGAAAISAASSRVWRTMSEPSSPSGDAVIGGPECEDCRVTTDA